MFFIFVIILSVVCNIVAEDANMFRIIGGTIAAEDSFAYQASLRYNSSHLCSGTIVHTSWIMTVAHCFQNRETQLISVYVASNNVSTGGIEYLVDRVIAHENWRSLTYENDIAILHLIRPIVLIENRASIGILTRKPVPDGAIFTVAGWGDLAFKGPSPEQLMVIRQIKINQTDCRSRGIPIHPTNMCGLSASGIGVCDRDSGSPGIYQNRIVSIVSYSFPCATSLPDVYTDITQYVDWVQDKIRNPLI